MLIVTATDLSRLMACNGSRLMIGQPIIERDNTVRLEGDAADWLVNQVIADHFTVEELIDRKAPNGIYITVEMVDFLESYLATAKHGMLQKNTSYAGVQYMVNGRADLIIYDDVSRCLHIDDLKYGWGIVEPEMNWTLISHAIGFMRQNPDVFVREIMFTIHQPRPHHPHGRIRSWRIDVHQLMELANQIDRTLSAPNDILNTGVHCYKCPALATCPAARKAGMNGIDASEKAFEDNIDNNNLSFQLDHLSRAIKVLEQLHGAYSDLAIHRVREGQIVPNYGLEIEKTNTMWMDFVTPDLIYSITKKDITKKEMVTPNQAKKLGVREEVVLAFTERRNKGIKLVRMDINAKAQKMFNQPKGN